MSSAAIQWANKTICTQSGPSVMWMCYWILGRGQVPVQYPCLSTASTNSGREADRESQAPRSVHNIVFKWRGVSSICVRLVGECVENSALVLETKGSNVGPYCVCLFCCDVVMWRVRYYLVKPYDLAPWGPLQSQPNCRIMLFYLHIKMLEIELLGSLTSIRSLN